MYSGFLGHHKYLLANLWLGITASLYRPIVHQLTTQCLAYFRGLIRKNRPLHTYPPIPLLSSTN